MKRSEMISKIVAVIPGDEYWISNYEDAERVLKVIEEAGMLPPPIEMDEDEIDDSIYTITHDGEVCTWEKE